MMGDTDSSSSSRADDLIASSFSSQNNHRNSHKHKVVVYNQVLRKLVSSNVADTLIPGFEDELWAHFNRLPTRYAMEVNVERSQDVLMHKRLLHMAHHPATRPALEVQLVQVGFASGSDSQRRIEPQWPMHEITISTNDKPKLFNQLTCLLSEIGLNIQEAHAFSTTDGYSLDVFLVDGWDAQDSEQLKLALAKKISRIEKNQPGLDNSISLAREKEAGLKLLRDLSNIPYDVSNTLDVDLRFLKFEKKIASGSIGDLYKGTLYNQDVAIKVLRNEYLNDAIHKEFVQEVDIMRKVQHMNVLRFIGASTRPPCLCIVTEFMAGGSVYNFLKQNGVFPRQSLIRVAVDVSKGMNYLHQNNIIHRDLKAANLLMDGKGVVKISDFGIARVQAQSGVMTAETGTYRWMAPEVIEHKPYDHKADVFSFGIVLWELLTGKIPYDNLTPLQAAVGVVQKGLRPAIPAHADPVLAELMERCWQHEPSLRPHFSEILETLLRMSKRALDKKIDRQNEKSSRIAPPTFIHPTA